MGLDQHLDRGAAAKGHVVVLSDVHLGTDGPTVWYQRDVHEAYLVHLLDWVLAEAEQVRELVLLGDVVDLWTYPGHERPPTFADIVATHPAVLGPDGKLGEVLDALDGAVTYVPGNHDMGVTAEEVATIASPGGHHVRLVTDAPYLPLGEGSGLALTHGHDFTLFNAPHLRNPWAPLPVGYFVTRAVSTGWARRLAPGQTVADLAGQGAPNGIDLGSLGAIASGLGAWSITASLLDFVCAATGVTGADTYLLPDGRVVTLDEVRAAYANCWTEWVVDHGGGLVGTASAVRSALADLDGSYLGWFAQQLAFTEQVELVVMGHTHVPIAGIDTSPIRYLNTGFDCPSGPDRDSPSNPQRTTFAVVDVEALDGEIWEVVHDDDGDLVCRAATAGRARIGQSTGMDFSTYVELDNTLGAEDLDLVASTAEYGFFAAPPPERVGAGEVGRFWIQDSFGPSGSTGTATYVGRDGGDELVLRFGCPTLGANLASGAAGIATRTGAGPWIEGEVVRRGHPLFVRFTV
ncbi:metallophosphoesterase [Aquihabitans sp. G128]|uniref:metallophosphoesterase n=1 Tax=Aquihabitans sp. G128 TaxID=2849779 RepID=UPI001C2229FC|nr:metallophosphoesterase [Aquihabitans sp. G128]QXC61996.1 metallophosphoesterase [Aquihabitans sp. G128]